MSPIQTTTTLLLKHELGTRSHKLCVCVSVSLCLGVVVRACVCVCVCVYEHCGHNANSLLSIQTCVNQPCRPARMWRPRGLSKHKPIWLSASGLADDPMRGKREARAALLMLPARQIPPRFCSSQLQGIICKVSLVSLKQPLPVLSPICYER